MSEPSSQPRMSKSALIFICLAGGLIAFGVIYDAFDYFWGYGWAVDELRTILQLIIVDDDSWWPMYNAANVRLYGDGIYQTVFFEDGMKFQYPPLSILPFVIFIKIGMGWETIREFMNFISFVSILSIIGSVYYLIISVFKKFTSIENFDWKYKISFILIAIVGTFGFDAIVKAQYLGQIQVILDLCICLAFLLFLTNKKYLAGACLALAALVKPQITLLLVWAIIRKEKEVIVGMIAIFVPAGVISLYGFGFLEHVHYLESLSQMGKHGEAYWPNQSINGLLHRLISDVDPLKFPVNSYAPYNPIVYGFTIVTTVMLILLGLFCRPESGHTKAQGKTPISSSFDMATMLLLVTMASPIAWYHHYGILWPIFIAAFVVIAWQLYQRRDLLTVATAILFSLSFLLLSNRFPVLTKEQFASSPINLVQSYYLFGAFLMLAALFMLRRNLVVKSDVD